ncbi:M23 family metallopeptidase [Dissulfurirhabdus thermomarina]|uniref:M23 family metallopeptidase n=1 Tax=Dissulfurirhabdus thermomarina TaxID=1765737 RepID=A0A6N9TPN8_DISTH|nr:M23 family metallopeptidase [Dissulfurirhabdus thermomarina]NDY42063.1 M23 family metallopeptidase [Dissulfurirhabdus thermomarina]NMX24537.1 M23 family metallopeptidase [Dissulfurirhabdus thermomarina]
MKRILVCLLSFVVVAVLVLAGLFAFFRLEGTPPAIEVVAPPEVIGRDATVRVRVRDDRSGVRRVTVALVQDQRVYRVGAGTLPPAAWWRGTGVPEREWTFSFHPHALGLAEGPARLRVEAWDASARNVLAGNWARLERPVRVDITPPRVQVLSRMHNVAVGGAGLVAYRLSERPADSGVVVGDRFFPGYPKPGGRAGDYAALVAIPFDVQQVDRVYVEARDAAGNVGRAGVPFLVLRRTPRSDRIRITDDFLRRKMPGFARPDEPETDLLAVFLRVNGELRRENARRLRELCAGSRPELLWSGAFLRLPRSSRRAGFAERRTYLYRGREVDRAVHLGVDLAATAHSPVPAANAGRVAFAGELGIYGNTVLLDHGFGLFSLYGHLSSIAVTPGQEVRKGQVIGRTGMTGLAGGDHLHFAMLVHGVFVDPVEWWDRKWIEGHILANLAAE